MIGTKAMGEVSGSVWGRCGVSVLGVADAGTAEAGGQEFHSGRHES